MYLQCAYLRAWLVVAVTLCSLGCSGDSTLVASRQQVIALGQRAIFQASHEPEVAAPQHVKSINPELMCNVYRVESEDTKSPRSDGSVIARLEVSGIPARNGLPDGNYYLWVGGQPEAPQAQLVGLDGSVTKAIEVFTRASGPTLAWEVNMEIPASVAATALPRETRVLWLHFCTSPAVPDGSASGQLCVRIPAS